MKIVAPIVMLVLAPLAVRADARHPDAAIAAVAMEQDTCAFWNTGAHYIVAVNADGTGNYIGLEIAHTKGSVALNLPVASFAAIARQLRKMSYFTLRDSYTSTDDGCKALHTDQTSMTFYAIRGGKVKRIEVYWGCQLPGVMDQFMQLAQLVDKLTGASALIGGQQ